MCPCGWRPQVPAWLDAVNGHKAEPTPGNFTVCHICGLILIVGTGGELRAPTVTELFSLPETTRRVLVGIRKAVKRAMANPPRGAGGHLN